MKSIREAINLTSFTRQVRAQTQSILRENDAAGVNEVIERLGMTPIFPARIIFEVFGLCGLFYVISLLTHSHTLRLLLFLPVAALVGAELILSLRRYIIERSVTVQVLAECDYPEAVGPLIDTLEYESKATCDAAKRGLIRLLPRLQASDAHLLNQMQRHALHKILIGMDTLNARPRILAQQSRFEFHMESSLDKLIQEKPDLPLTDEQRVRLETLRQMREKYVDEDALRVAILKALEQIGGADSLPYVQDVAAGATKTSEDIRVRRAAQECLPFLQARTQMETVRGTLLRPVESIERNPETLVRPAVETRDDDLQELLRQSDKPE